MDRPELERELAKSVVNVEAAPSDLALDAIVAGVPVEQTTAKPAATVDYAWPSRPRSV
nr:hypothetical protein [Rhodococcus sp. 06-621-2]